MRFLAFVLAVVSAIVLGSVDPSPLQAQGCQQSGTVTPNHVARWVSPCVIGDGGAATSGNITELGIYRNGSLPFCITSSAVGRSSFNPASTPYTQLCITQTVGDFAAITLNSYNGAAAADFEFIVNGTVYPLIPGGSGIPAIGSISALQSSTASLGTVYVQGYYTANDGGEGIFVQSSSPCVDNGGTLIVDAASHCYIRATNDPGYYSVKWFGAKGDWNATSSTGTNDTTAIQSTVTVALAAGKSSATPNHTPTRPEVHFPNGFYRVTSTIDLGSTASLSLISDEGSVIYPSAANYAFKSIPLDVYVRGMKSYGGGGLFNVNTTVDTVSYPGRLTFDACGARAGSDFAVKMNNLMWLSLVIQNCFFEDMKVLKNIADGAVMRGNQIYISNAIGSYPIENYNRLDFEGLLEVPSADMVSTYAWIYNSNYDVSTGAQVIVSEGRFGGENGGGATLVYNNASGIESVSLQQSAVIIHDTNFANNSNRPIIVFNAIPNMHKLDGVKAQSDRIDLEFTSSTAPATFQAKNINYYRAVYKNVQTDVRFVGARGADAEKGLRRFIIADNNFSWSRNADIIEAPTDRRNFFPTGARFCDTGWTTGSSTGTIQGYTLTTPSGTNGGRILLVSAGATISCNVSLFGFTALPAGLYTVSFKTKAGAQGSPAPRIDVTNIDNYVALDNEYRTYSFPVYYDGSTAFTFAIQLVGVTAGDWVELSEFSLNSGPAALPFSIPGTATKWDGTPAALNNAFTQTINDTSVTVAQTSHGYVNGQVVRLSGFTNSNGQNFNITTPITRIDADSYSIQVQVKASGNGNNVGGAGNVIPQFWQIGPKEYFGPETPINGTWTLGDQVRYWSPAAGSFIGVVNTAAGTPGTWKTWGAVSP